MKTAEKLNKEQPSSVKARLYTLELQGKKEVAVANNEKLHTLGTGDGRGKLNCERSDAVKTIKDICIFQN